MAYLVLTVKGTRDKKRKVLARRMVEFCVRELDLDLMNIEIDVKFKLMPEAFGYCSFEDNHLRPRQFLIEVRKNQRVKNLLSTLAHEMVHVKQYARGALAYRGDFAKTLWKGHDHSKTDYFDQPWEKEAYKLEQKLYDKFVKNGLHVV